MIMHLDGRKLISNGQRAQKPNPNMENARGQSQQAMTNMIMQMLQRSQCFHTWKLQWLEKFAYSEHREEENKELRHLPKQNKKHSTTNLTK